MYYVLSCSSDVGVHTGGSNCNRNTGWRRVMRTLPVASSVRRALAWQDTSPRRPCTFSSCARHGTARRRSGLRSPTRLAKLQPSVRLVTCCRCTPASTPSHGNRKETAFSPQLIPLVHSLLIINRSFLLREFRRNPLCLIKMSIIIFNDVMLFSRRRKYK